MRKRTSIAGLWNQLFMRIKEAEEDFIPVDFDFEWQEAPWLGSDFSSDCWLLFGSLSVDWRVKIDDGSFLTDSGNIQLCTSFKAAFMLFMKGGYGWYDASPSYDTLKRKCRAALSAIDLMLIYAPHLQLSRVGLAGLTASNLKGLLEQLASHPSRAESIYQWQKSVLEFGRKIVGEISPAKIAAVLEANPFLADTLELDVRAGVVLPSQQQLSEMRAAFYLLGYYQGYKRSGFSLNSAKLSKLLYVNTLSGCSTPKPALPFFNCMSECVKYTREFDGVPVVTGNGTSIGPTALAMYKSFLNSLSGLPLVGLPGPSSIDVQEFDSFLPKTNKLGRYRTLPADLAFKLLRNSIEFHLGWGGEIIQAFCRLAEHATKNNILFNKLSDKVVQDLVGEKLRVFGVKTLGLSTYAYHKGNTPLYKSTPEDHYVSLRSNHGLIELLIVYVGAAQFSVGLLAARRQDELSKMPIDQCLDVTRSWLVFDRAKSTVGLDGRRDTIARPIDPISVAMLDNLLTMQRRLKECGYIPELMTAFSVPPLRGRSGLLEGNTNNMNVAFDMFCDYFESDRNQVGHRYYIRQHQLRRMFALLFFHAYGVSGLDTLRWMMGHTNLAHLWNYLTDVTDGASLRGAEAQHIAREIRAKDDSDYEDLRSMLSEYFGTTYLSIIDAEDLEDRITWLMEEKKITVVPQFLRTATGEVCKLLVHVTGDKPWLL